MKKECNCRKMDGLTFHDYKNCELKANLLLDKFDKDFDETFPYHIPMMGEAYNPVTISNMDLRRVLKAFAHSHLEEAYRAGVEKGKEDKARSINCGGKIKCDTKNCFLHEPPYQSNLERLIEKTGEGEFYLKKTIDEEEDPSHWNAYLDNGKIYEGSGSTPTEAVENLIKALNL